MNTVVKKIETILKSPYDTNHYVDLIREIFPKVSMVSPDKFRKEFTNFSTHIEGSIHVGNYRTPDKKNIIIMAVQLKKAGYVENSRSTQRSYAKKLIENANADAAFIAFYTEGESKWRLSFVRLDYEMKIENGCLKTTENLTPAKRYSYLVGENEPCHTAISRFERFIIDSAADSEHPTLDDLENAFSVEKVTDEFFKLYCEKFHQLREKLEENEDFRIEAEQHNFTSAQFAKKLMGQIVFLYFLQKKGWLGVGAWPNILTEKEYKNAYYARGAKSRELIPMLYHPVGDGTYRISSAGLNTISDEDEAVLAMCVKGKPWGSGPHNFMRKLFEIAEKKNQNFFDELLEPLFYDALNVNRGEQGYCPALHCRIPFLSGGLFEPIDGYDWEHNNFNLPNEVFSNATIKGREADGILDVFDRYNFTMSEDEPMEREVAIDPEMLGKVFENLLEVNDRKSKGAFYTPREIVHYMCQESLINYLTNTLQIEEEDIREFILYGDFMKDEDTVKEKRQGNGGMYISENLYKLDADGKVVVDRLTDMDEALKNVRVADPAVGSGAFPLGMLNEIVRARQNISAYMAITMNAYDTRMMYQMDRSPHNLKYETIKNCIFAADIEPSAVDIAQLRLWLSLVIDDEINPNAQSALDGHKNPLPLPNLESNILCGNSLIDEFEGTRLIKESELFGDSTYQLDMDHSRFESIVRKLIEKQDELFRCDSTEKKKQLKNEIESLRDMVILSQLEGCDADKIQRYHESKRMASKPYALWQLDFARVFREKGGFDIVIGNPPWGAKLNKPEKSILTKKYPEIDSSTPNSFAYFIGLGNRLSTESMNLVLPDSILIKDYSKTRKLIYNTISEVIWYQNAGVPSDIRLFKSVDHDVCVIHVKQKKQHDNIIVKIYKCIEKEYVKSEWQFRTSDIMHSQFEYSINLKIKQEDIQILNKLNAFKPISSFMQCHEGIHTGNIRNKLFKNEFNPQYKPLFYGGGAGDSISTYHSKRSGWYVDYRKDIVDKMNGEYASLRDESIFKFPKIYITRTGNPFKAFYDNNFYASNNFFSLQMSDMSLNNEDNLLLILPFINSKVCQYFIRVFAAPRLGNTFIETKILHLLKLPMPVISENKKVVLLEKVKEIISVKENDIYQDTSELEKALNQIVYQCYNLSDDEIKIIENNVAK